MRAEQLEFNTDPVMIVPNHWGPVFHVVQGSRTWNYDYQLGSFLSVETALQWAAQFGVVAEVDPMCEFVTPDLDYWNKYCKSDWTPL